MYKPAVSWDGVGNFFLAVSLSIEAIGTDAHPFKKAMSIRLVAKTIFLIAKKRFPMFVFGLYIFVSSSTPLD